MWDKKPVLNGIYDWAEFTLANGASNYDVKSNVISLFSNIVDARKVVIRTNRDIGVRFNSTLFPLVKIDSGETPAEVAELMTIKNMYMTNASGSDATIRVWLI